MLYEENGQHLSENRHQIYSIEVVASNRHAKSSSEEEKKRDKRVYSHIKSKKFNCDEK